MRYILILALSILSASGYCQSKQIKKTAMKKEQQVVSCKDKCCEKTIACKLTSPEMQQRKATVITSLKNQVLENRELKNGYSYRFIGSDTVVDELVTFVKTERQCCDFFDFDLKVTGDAKSAWLTITGPKGVKDFIVAELGL